MSNYINSPFDFNLMTFEFNKELSENFMVLSRFLNDVILNIR